MGAMLDCVGFWMQDAVWVCEWGGDSETNGNDLHGVADQTPPTMHGTPVRHVWDPQYIIQCHTCMEHYVHTYLPGILVVNCMQTGYTMVGWVGVG